MSIVEIKPIHSEHMEAPYRHRVKGGPRTPSKPGAEKKCELQARADMLERMVTRFAERVRLFESLHTVRLEEAGLIVASVYLLHRKWRDTHPNEPDKGSSFIHWIERLGIESIVQYTMGEWDSSTTVISQVGFNQTT